MAIFNIKRGDSIPPIMLTMRVAGTDPQQYWDVRKDDVGSGTVEDNAGDPSSAGYEVRFIMKNINTGELVGHPGITVNRYTGQGEIYTKTIGGEQVTVLRYNWRAPDEAYDPTSSTQVSTIYAGDTAKAGAYRGEFEVIYPALPGAGVQKFKRTFPSTPGDSLIINILPDENDKTVGEQI